MAIQEYALAVGHNNAAGLWNVEDFLFDRGSRPRRIVLVALLVPPGSVQTVTLDKKAHWDGTQTFTWTWRAIPLTCLDALIVRCLGNYDTDNASMTTRTKKRDGTFANFNTEIAIPQGYTIRRSSEGFDVGLDVVAEFRVVAAL